LKRLGAIAHRVEDLIGRLRDAEIEPSAAVVDLCLASVDVLKKPCIASGPTNRNGAPKSIRCSAASRNSRRQKKKTSRLRSSARKTRTVLRMKALRKRPQ